jgi:hypothetical protein
LAATNFPPVNSRAILDFEGLPHDQIALPQGATKAISLPPSQSNPRPYLVISRMQPLRAALDQAGVFQRDDIFMHPLAVAAEGAGEGGDAGFGAGVELAQSANGVEC